VTEAQLEERPLRRSTRARTQAASRSRTQRQSSTPARSTPALARIHKYYTRAPTREIQELRFVSFPTWFPATWDQRAHVRFYTMV
jgi:hypothetical protein